jgi:hypothetical protein
MKAQGVDVDYVTLLMITGDLWQFRYPCSANESIATSTVAGLDRITKFYQLDASVLADIASHASKCDRQNTRDAMTNWQTAIRDVAAGNDLPNDLALFSLRATTYLNTTYTAAYLWIESYPELAEKLLADPTYTSMYAMFDSSNVMLTPVAVSQLLEAKIATIRSASSLAIELLTTPSATGCMSQLRDHAEHLREKVSSIAELLKDEDRDGKGNTKETSASSP